MKGLTLLEVLISLVLLTLFILGGMSLYATTVTQTKRARALLTALWLAKGKLDSAAESRQPLPEKSGRFKQPFAAYDFRITQTPLPNDPALQLLTVEVQGPSQTRIKLERIVAPP